MTQFDSRGLPLSTTSDRASDCYRRGVDLLLSAWPGAAEALDEAIAADPDFALAHAARARLHAVRGEPMQARQHIATAARLVARRGSERERSHVDIVSLAINGQPARALERVLEHTDIWPRDAVIVSLPLGAFGLFAFSGMADHDQARVDFCERLARHFEADDWWFLTYRGWAHTENGNVTLGQALSQRGHDLRRNNANAAHALLHAMYESGAGEDAETLVADWLPSYDRAGIIHGHIAWHAALGALERGQPDRALATYEKYIQPPASAGVPLNVVSDTASFLWRLRAYGHAVPEGLWEAVATYSREVFQKAGLAFADVHMVVIAAETGERVAAEQRVEQLSGLVEAGSLPPVVPEICRAALAFAEEDYAGCARILEPVSTETVRIGGSGAQREMIEDMLLLSLMRSGEAVKAAEILDRRLHRRPSPRDTGWRNQLAV